MLKNLEDLIKTIRDRKNSSPDKSYTNKLLNDKNLSVFENALDPWRGETMKKWVEPLLKHGIKFDFPIHRPINELTSAQYQLLWDGNEYFKGLMPFSLF